MMGCELNFIIFAVPLHLPSFPSSQGARGVATVHFAATRGSQAREEGLLCTDISLRW